MWPKEMSWLVFILSALACYRITIVITRDKIGRPLRKLPALGRFFSCTYCVSVWIGFLITLALLNAGFFIGLWLSIILSFAFSAVTIMLDRTFTSDYVT